MTGWMERWIWFVVEHEASKVLNGSKVTIGSFRVDWSEILQGRISVEGSNVILHTKERREWGWESPLIARVGCVSAKLNIPIILFHEIVLKKKLPIEVYSVSVSDIQVFIERHDQVINVYLCDPAAVLPTPPYANSPPPTREPNDEPGGSASDLTQLPQGEQDKSSKGDEDKAENRERAEKLVQDMLKTVQSLGKAAQEGSLNTAVKQHGVEMVEHVRNELSNRNRNTPRLEQGVAVMEQVGKVAAKSLKAPKMILPERKPGEGPPPPDVRIGHIVAKDIRVFTKDSWISVSNFGSNNKLDSMVDADAQSQTTENQGKKGNWNTPIYIESLVIRASELCPPMSAKDEDGMPAVYQRVDKVIEIVWRRLLAEMAKSNTGRLFSTAFGEVLSFIQTQPNSSSTSDTPTIKTEPVDSKGAKTPRKSTSQTNLSSPKVKPLIVTKEDEKSTIAKRPSGTPSLKTVVQDSSHEVRV